jgi:hypothetical protein
VRLRLVWKYCIDVSLGLLFGLYWLCDGQLVNAFDIYSLLGSHFLKVCKVGVAYWWYWAPFGPFSVSSLSGVMTKDYFIASIFFLLGAAILTAFMGVIGTKQAESALQYLASLCGGLLMGFGGELAGGGSMSSLVAGITSGSVHGLLWLACAIAGSGVVVGCKIFLGKEKKSGWRALLT